MHKVIEIICKNSPHLSWIENNTILLARHGSRAYGTHNENSDEDFKGVAVPTKKYFHGFSLNFEQAILSDPNPDTVIYGVKKFFQLATQCNPSLLEMLFASDEDIIINNKFGQIIIDNRNLFLTKKARFTFGGFAHNQLKRIKLHRGFLLNPPKGKPERKSFGLEERTQIPTSQLTAAKSEINKSLDKLNFKFLDALDEAQKIEVKNSVIDLLSDFKIYSDQQYEAMARKIGFDDNIIEILKKERSYDQAKRDYDNYNTWKKNRNEKRSEDEAKFGYDCKHAYHLIRLLRMGSEILSEGKVLVKRPDYEELVYIRNGGWTYDQLIEESEKIEAQMPELYEKSTLPKTPNLNKINNICSDLVEEHLSQQ